MSIAKQNYASATEEGFNQQINTELQASQVYLSMHSWAARADVALPGLAKFFLESCEEERKHAQGLIDYQNMRGGKVVLGALVPPDVEWKSAKNAIEASLQLEKDVNRSLLNLHKIVDENNDPQACDFIESNYLEEQVRAIKVLSGMVTQLNRVGDELGLYIWDQDLLNGGTGAGVNTV